MTATIRILLVDDHAVFREGVSFLLEAQGNMSIVGHAANGVDAIGLYAAVKPDVVLMDIGMKNMNGIECAEEIRSRDSSAKILFLSMFAGPEHVYRALGAGAMGYVLKDTSGPMLIEAINSVYQGKRYFSRDVVDVIAEGYLSHTDGSAAPNLLDTLSGREKQVLQLVVEGNSSAEIGKMLHLSPKTVDTYRSRVMSKLDIPHTPGLVKFALQHGIISLDD